MALFSKLGPVLVKASNDSEQQLAALQALKGTLPPGTEKQLEADIRAVSAGAAGEQKVLFELMNSHMPMAVLHDLRIEHEGLSAQIDFLVLTPQRSFVLECKNLYGDIEVNERGEFIRKTGRGREGMYSPITQNKRHLGLIRSLRKEAKGLLTGIAFEANYDDLYRGLIVLANPKTVLDCRKAPKEIGGKIIRADQLIEVIRSINAERGYGKDKQSWGTVMKNAEWFLSQHRPGSVDYASRYRQQQHAAEQATGQAPLCPKCGAPMVLRTAKRGERAGKQFYGCSMYPKCRGIVNVGE